MKQEQAPDAYLSKLEQINVGEVLSSVTRAERRILLGVAMLGVIVAHSGLIPTRISALGIDFERADQRSLLLVLVLVVSYFTITFGIYAAADFFAWRALYDSTLLMHLRHEPAVHPRKELPEDKPWERLQKRIERRRWLWAVLARRNAVLRGVWEFVLPLAAGAYTIVVLLWTRYHLT
jgi:hypothetical protein